MRFRLLGIDADAGLNIFAGRYSIRDCSCFSPSVTFKQCSVDA